MILDLKNIKYALFEKVKKAYKVPLAEVVAATTTKEFNYNQGRAIYISEAGLYQLIFSSRLEAADAFRTWVFEPGLLMFWVKTNYKQHKQEKFL